MFTQLMHHIFPISNHLHRLNGIPTFNKIKNNSMKKILLLCDGDHFPSGAVRFIRQMRESEPIYVKGIFFTQVDTIEMIPIGFMPISSPLVKFKESEKLLADKSRE